MKRGFEVEKLQKLKNVSADLFGIQLLLKQFKETRLYKKL